MGQLTNDEGEAKKVHPIEHSNEQKAPPKGKKDKYQGEKPWQKLGEKKTSSCIQTSTQHEVESLFTID